MNWTLDEKVILVLMPLLQKLVERFGDMSEFPMRVAKNVRESLGSFFSERETHGCGVVRFMQGAWGAAPCCGKAEPVIFIHMLLCEDDVLVCEIHYPLYHIRKEVEEFIRENSQEILSELRMQWQFSER